MTMPGLTDEQQLEAWGRHGPHGYVRVIAAAVLRALRELADERRERAALADRLAALERSWR